jgi:hypothetical protein
MGTALDSLTDAQKFALSALLEVQSASTVGDFVSETDEGDYVVTYRFATTLAGYPPTIVESELLPADGALLAPDWVPWSDRMDDYRAAQLALGEAAAESDDDEDDDDDDDEDAFGSDTLHGGDLDGVDIDEIDDEPADAVDDLSDEVSGPLDLQVDEGDQPESEGDSGSENPPRVPRRRKRASKEQQNNQGD